MKLVRLGSAVTMAAALAAVPGAGGSAHAAPTAPHSARCVESRVVIDRFAFDALPCDTGTMSVFDSSDDADITTAVWEHSDANGTQVSMTASVFRSPDFSSGRVFRDWAVAWQGRPAEQAADRAVRSAHGIVWLSADQVMWLQRPGAGITVRADRTRHRATNLVRVADRVFEVGR